MLTNTERQQIVEEVNAGTYGIDEALDDIAAAQKGEEVRKALYAEALVLNREGHVGSTDLIARQQIANLQTSVNGQISTLRTEVGEDIDDLETALNSGLATQNGKIAAQNATIANVVANYNVEYGSTELWASTGETGALAAGTTVTLSEDVSHFDYIDIYSFCGNSNVLDTVPVDAKLQSNAGYALRWVNLSDPGSGTYEAYVRIVETKIKIIGTTLTIVHQVTYRNGSSVTVSGAEITQSNRSTYVGEFGIMKVVGRKITANTELEDVRIGADGTEYNSAGAAVRGQVSTLQSGLTGLDARVSALEQDDDSGSGVTGGGVPTSVRQAMLTLLKKAVYTETGLDDEITAVESWASEVTGLTVSPSSASITGSGTQQLTALTTPAGGTVTWESSNTAIATVSSNGLVTGVSNGTATITATSGDVYATCTVVVTGFATLTSIEATYTQTGTVTPEDSLSDLVSDLVVVATYDDSSTATLTSSQYTLSGTLAVGTSTITVTYGDKTDTFSVTVTSDLLYSWNLKNSLVDTVGGVTAVASAGTGVDAPAITSDGLVFNAATQRLSLGDINLSGKTIEIDVASFDWKGDNSKHIRFLLNESNTGPIIFRSGQRWNAYLKSSSGGNASWKSSWATLDTGAANKNIFNGKTVKLVSETDGTLELYLDDTLWGTMTECSYGSDTQDLAIGGASGYSQSSGDQCYDMTISAIRIRSNPAS